MTSKSSTSFSSSNQILQWISENFTYKIDKIENASNGLLYLEIINKLYPKSICSSKINKPKSNNIQLLSYDSILKNFKLLQNLFKVNKIQKNFDMQRLMSGSFQENLEFLQWFKSYYENIYSYVRCNDVNYESNNSCKDNNIEEEPGKIISKSKSEGNVNSLKEVKFHNILNNNNIKSKVVINEISSINNFNSINKLNNINNQISEQIKNERSRLLETAKKLISERKEASNKKQTKNVINQTQNNEELYNILLEYDAVFNKIEKEKEHLIKKNEEKRLECEELSVNNKDLKKVIGLIQRERDFYYSKLRDIEYLACKNKITNQLVDKILRSDSDLLISIINEDVEVKTLK